MKTSNVPRVAGRATHGRAPSSRAVFLAVAVSAALAPALSGAVPLPMTARAGAFPVLSSLARRPRLDIEPIRPRDYVQITGLLETAVAVMADGEIISLGDDGVLARAGLDGHQRWSLLVGPSRGAPALDANGNCYVAGRDGNLYAVDPHGEIRWLRPLTGTPFRGVAVGERVLAITLDTGELQLFSVDRGQPLLSILTHHVPSAAPIITADGEIALPTRDGLIVRTDERGHAAAHRVSPKAAVGPLAAGGESEIYAGTADGDIVRVERNGDIRWRVSTGLSLDRAPVLSADGSVVAVAGREVFAISPGGTLKWRRAVVARVVGSPLAADDGSVFIAIELAIRGRARGAVLGLDPSGRPMAQLPLSGPPTPSLMLSDHALWIGLLDGTIRRFPIVARGLAHSPWPSARGGVRNAGRSLRPLRPESAR